MKFLKVSFENKKCTSIKTDGAANMTGKNKGFINLLRKSNANCKNLIGFHCIIHMELLAAKDGTETLKKLTDVLIKDLIKLINFIKKHALINREFNSFLKVIDPDLTSYFITMMSACFPKVKCCSIFSKTRELI